MVVHNHCMKGLALIVSIIKVHILTQSCYTDFSKMYVGRAQDHGRDIKAYRLSMNVYLTSSPVGLYIIKEAVSEKCKNV